MTETPEDAIDLDAVIADADFVADDIFNEGDELISENVTPGPEGEAFDD